MLIIAMFEILGWIWSLSSYDVTVVSCPPVFVLSIKTLFQKVATRRHLLPISDRKSKKLWSASTVSRPSSSLSIISEESRTIRAHPAQ